MMDRPALTSKLVLQITGGNQDLITCLHLGLYETPMSSLYPYLNLDDLVVFAAETWQLRNSEFDQFAGVVDAQSLYDIFKYVNTLGFPWYARFRRVSDEQQRTYGKLNPYHGKNLQARIEAFLQEHDDYDIRSALIAWPNLYVFECQYEDQEWRAGTEGINQVIPMGFQLKYPKRGKIVPAYAKEIARRINRYPREVDLSITQQVQQLEMF